MYPIYAVMFADPVSGGGLSPGAISGLFVIWSLCMFGFEIPTGVLADRMSRRSLLVAGPLLTGTGFALWTWCPSFGAYAAGFVLWAAGSALRSGTLQALLYDTLAARDQAHRYVALAGRVRAMGAAGVLFGTVLAVPLTAWGGYRAVGIASVVACLLCSAASALLPEDAPPRRPPPASADGTGTHSDTCTDSETGAAGVREVLSDAVRRVYRIRAVRRVFVLVVALTWVGALDEYLPLLADELWPGAAAATGVSLLMVVVAVGDIVGGHAAALTSTMRPRRLGRWLLGGAGALAAGAMTGHPAGIVLVSFGFAVFGWSLVIADAMLQDRVPSRSRATTTSIVGVGEEMVAIVAFGAWALGSQSFGPTTLFTLAAVPYLAISLPLLVSCGATTAIASRR
ncbi:MFS transporter [Gordonia rhizosphera]|uniref:Putative major facilitator superfamily transporter n=1 Tax=Gordonia rhizosphera NBRC 16068 TaxID=1108045 RepID=K6W8L0_9ACTN|nr:MFS transporter [Gordonia rhizosphera]GAB88562.1 putative major facilitator superfamily transporter [Gordonia rhizosphera NBRC 16068]